MRDYSPRFLKCRQIKEDSSFMSYYEFVKVYQVLQGLFYTINT